MFEKEWQASWRAAMLANLLPEGPVSVRADMRAATGEAADGIILCPSTVFNVSKIKKKKMKR